MHDRTETERPRPLPRIHRLAERLAHRNSTRRAVSHAVPLDRRTEALHRPGVFPIRGDDHLVDGGFGECRVVRVGQHAGLSLPRERDQQCKGHDAGARPAMQGPRCCPRSRRDGHADSWPGVRSGSHPPCHHGVPRGLASPTERSWKFGSTEKIDIIQGAQVLGASRARSNSVTPRWSPVTNDERPALLSGTKGLAARLQNRLARSEARWLTQSTGQRTTSA